MNSKAWGPALAAFVLMAFLVPSAIGALVPMSIWMTVRKVDVEDSVVGEPIRINADRTIHRDFTGRFKVDLRKEEETGFSSACHPDSDDVPYREGAVYPEDLDMDWWLDVPPYPSCYKDGVIPAGRYFMITTWETSPWWAFGGVISQSVTSNIFTIAPKP